MCVTCLTGYVHVTFLRFLYHNSIKKISHNCFTSLKREDARGIFQCSYSANKRGFQFS